MRGDVDCTLLINHIQCLLRLNSLIVLLLMLRSSRRLLHHLHHLTPVQASLRKMSTSLYTDETPAAVKEAKVKIADQRAEHVHRANMHPPPSGSTLDHSKHPQWAKSPNPLGGAKGCVQHSMDDHSHQHHDQRAEKGLVSATQSERWIFSPFASR